MEILGFIVLIVCLIVGVRFGGLGLAAVSGLGLVFFVFVIGMVPGKPPIDVMLTIMAVVTCSGFLQASKGLDVMLKYAEKLGATRVLNGKECDIIKEIGTLTGNLGVEKVFETAGSPATIAQTAHLVKAGGTIVLVGLSANPELTFNFGKIMAKEAKIESVFRYRNLYPRAISAIAEGIVNVDDVVSHEFSFDDIQKAFDAAINDKENVVKAVIKM